MNGLLAKQKAESEALLKELEDNYNRRHEEYAEALFPEDDKWGEIMGSLIAYSGIATKVKAMERWRIKMSSSLRWRPWKP